jgi:hypothetical protein
MSAQSFGPVNSEFSPERMPSSGRLPSLFAGFAAFLVPHDRIDTVRRLIAAGKAPLPPNPSREVHRHTKRPVRGVFGSPHGWLLDLLYFCIVTFNYAFMLWVPKATLASGLATVTPAVAVVALILHTIAANLSACVRLTAACRNGLPLVARAARRDFPRQLTYRTVQGTSP